MSRTLLLFLLLLIGCISYSQEKIAVYKSIVDSAIAPYFERSLLKKLKCQRFCLVGPKGNEIWFPAYEPFKNNKEEFLTVSFTYSFFSEAIDHFFSFDIAIDRNKNVKVDASSFTKIPKCISGNEQCNFIKKDSALKIALADSVWYSNNLEIEFKSPSNKNDYYWIVTGYSKERPASKMPRRDSPKRRKIISGLSGKIISWEEFLKPG